MNLKIIMVGTLSRDKEQGLPRRKLVRVADGVAGNPSRGLQARARAQQPAFHEMDISPMQIFWHVLLTMLWLLSLSSWGGKGPSYGAANCCARAPVNPEKKFRFPMRQLVLNSSWVSHVLRPYMLNNKLVVKLTTIIEGDPKAPFSIATTPRCWRGRYSFPRIDPLYPWSVPYNAES